MLTPDEARTLTDEVKNDFSHQWVKLLDLHEGKAHEVLGYPKWIDYFGTEFQRSKSMAHRVLASCRVVRILQSEGSLSMPTSPDKAVVLHGLRDDPRLLREAWEEALEEARLTSFPPTVKGLRQIVAEKLPMNGKEKTNAEAQLRRVHKTLATIEGSCAGLDEANLDRVLAVATRQDIAAMKSIAANAVTVLNRLRRNLKEDRR